MPFALKYYLLPHVGVRGEEPSPWEGLVRLQVRLLLFPPERWGEDNQY